MQIQINERKLEMKRLILLVFALILFACGTQMPVESPSDTQPTGLSVVAVSDAQVVQAGVAQTQVAGIDDIVFPASVVSTEIPFQNISWQSVVTIVTQEVPATVWLLNPQRPGLAAVVGYNENHYDYVNTAPYDRLFVRQFLQGYTLGGYEIPPQAYIFTQDKWGPKLNIILFSPEITHSEGDLAGLVCTGQECVPANYIVIPDFWQKEVTRPIIPEYPYCNVKESVVFTETRDWRVTLSFPDESIYYYIASSGSVVQISGQGGAGIPIQVTWEQVHSDNSTVSYKALFGEQSLTFSKPLDAFTGQIAGQYCVSTDCREIRYGTPWDIPGRPLNWISVRDQQYNWCN